jgi:hypothetical protein
LLRAVRDAAKSATGQDNADDGSSWAPHVTLAYSTATQPAEPIITTLGHQLPDCKVTIKHLSLVIQQGPERLWNWRSLAEIPLGDSVMPSSRRSACRHP